MGSNQQKADDPSNKIHSTGTVYRCTQCGVTHPYMFQAKDHAHSHNGEVDLDTIEVVDRGR